jgi:hypothetical protein
LLKYEPDELVRLLGVRQAAIEKDPSIQGAFEPDVRREDYDWADVVAVGKRIWDTLHIQAYNLVCGADEKGKEWRERIIGAFGVSVAAAVVALTNALISIGIAAALAGVLAALIIKHFFLPAARDGYKTACKIWKEDLPQSSD